MKEFNEFGPFAVGDQIIGKGFQYDAYLNGMSGEVVSSAFPHRYFADGVVRESYEVDWSNGEETIVPACCLRRRKPPASDTGEQLLATLITKWSAPSDRREPVTAHMAAYENLRAAMAVDRLVQRIEREMARGVA